MTCSRNSTQPTKNSPAEIRKAIPPASSKWKTKSQPACSPRSLRSAPRSLHLPRNSPLPGGPKSTSPRPLSNLLKSPSKTCPRVRRLVVSGPARFRRPRHGQSRAKYLQVLRQDEKNGAVLANLAAIQLEMNRLDEAEKHIKQALVSDPDDAYSLSILGYLKFPRKKYGRRSGCTKPALPNSIPQKTLKFKLPRHHSRPKGMRGAAETALRKAIQLEPNHASAHHNLAVIYLTQKPPLVETRQMALPKSLANGHPRNPDLEKIARRPKNRRQQTLTRSRRHQESDLSRGPRLCRIARRG